MIEGIEMNVHATKTQGVGPDGVHRPIAYSIAVHPRGETLRVVIPETLADEEFSLGEYQDPTFFRLNVFSTDQAIDRAKSWVRCSFRPAHNAGVTGVTSPLSVEDTQQHLRGWRLADLNDYTFQANTNSVLSGLKKRSYTFWGTNVAGALLVNRGNFEFMVQVGLHYTDGSQPAYCIVDPEMDMGPGGR